MGYDTAVMGIDIAGQEAGKLRVVQCRSVRYAIGKPYVFRLQLFAEQALRPSQWMHQKAALYLSAERVVHGSIFRVRFGRHTQEGFYYTVLFVSPLHQLIGQKRYRIFECKTVVDVLKILLQNVEVQFQVNGSFPTLPRIVQYHETDLHFFQRMVAEAGLCYVWKHEQNVSRLVICDDIGTVGKMRTFDAHDVLSMRKTQEVLPAKTAVNDHRDNMFYVALHRVSESDSPIPAVGAIYHYGVGQCDVMQAAQRALCAQKATEVRRQRLVVKTARMDSDLGQGVRMPDGSVWRVIAMEYALYDAGARADSGIEKARCQQMCVLTLIPASVSFACAAIPRVMCGLESVAVHADTTQHADLDDHGAYTLEHTQADQTAHFSHGVPHMQPLTLENGGAHFPVCATRHALAVYRQSDASRPVLLGVYSDSPVTAKNAYCHIVRSYGGHMLRVDDTEGQESITCVTRDKTQHIALSHHADDAGITLENTAGTMQVQAAEGITTRADKGQKQTIAGEHHMYVGKDCEISAEQGEVQCSAGQELRWCAEDVLQGESAQDLVWSSEAGMNVHSDGEMRLSSDILRVRATQYGCKAEQVCSFQASSMVWVAGGSRMVVGQQGVEISGNLISVIGG